MVRPKREGEWAPITARLSVDAARRLRVAAARRGTTQGRILDELILAALPPADPLPIMDSAKRSDALTIELLKSEMQRLSLSQSALARGLDVTSKSVSEWFERGRIPEQRQDAIRRELAKAGEKKH